MTLFSKASLLFINSGEEQGTGSIIHEDQEKISALIIILVGFLLQNTKNNKTLLINITSIIINHFKNFLNITM